MSMKIDVDLKDLSEKAAKRGFGYVIAETILNLMLMANDQFQWMNRVGPPTSTVPPSSKKTASS